MRGKATFTLAKSIRAGTVGALFLLLVFTSVYFITRSARRTRVSEERKDIPQQKIQRVEQLTHVEVKGDKGSFSLRANKHYIGEDNKYHLEGEVQVIDFGKDKRENVFFSGEKIIYEEGLNHFVSEGKSRVEYKDWVITSDCLDYDKTKEVFTSEKGINFLSRHLTGSAPRMVYSLQQERLRLFDKVHIVLPLEKEGALPLIIKAESLDYSRRERGGEVGGDVHLTQGENYAQAHSMKFFLSKDEEYVESILFKGKVRAHLEGEKREGDTDTQKWLSSSRGKRDLEADEIYLSVNEEFSKVSEIRASGACRYMAGDDSGWSLQVQGEFLEFHFTPEGDLERFHAFEKASLVEVEGESRKRRVLEGEEIALDQKSNTLIIRGDDSRGARIASQENEIVADEITLYLENNDLKARGNIKVVSRGLEGKVAMGYFSGELPVFITAGEVRYESSEKRFLFKTRIRAWQKTQMLLADELTFYEEKGELACQGGVKTVFYHTLNQKEERIEVMAEEMGFNPQANMVSFERNTSLKVRGVKLIAHSLSAQLENEKEGLKMANARGKVAFTWEKVKGRAEEAQFDLKEQVITLTGDPVFEDIDRGVTRGDKLTFYMGDGRIVVENKGQERSLTVIKS